MAALIGEIAGPAPVVIVLEDLHWADRPTLQLLRHLLRSPQPRRVLFLGTYRDAEVDDEHPLSELAGDLRRDGSLERLDLRGLAEDEVRELVAALGAPDAAPAFLHALHGETEGNPFFIEEVVGHLRHAGERLGTEVALAEAGVPEGVREVTTRRLRRLDQDAAQVVTLGAVVGREFDYGLLERVGRDGDGVTGDALVAALDAAVDARVIREAGTIGRYTFTHALVRATLYDGVSQLRRARLHARVGEAMAALHGEDVEPYLSQLAHHFALASPVERPERAVDFALAAARRADRLLAWEEAARHYRAALAALEHAGVTDERVRGDLLVALGESEERAGHGGAIDGELQRRRRRRPRERRHRAARPRRARLRGAVVAPGPGRLPQRGAAGGGAGGRRRGGDAVARAAARPARARALLRGRAGAAAGADRAGAGPRPARRRSRGRWRARWSPATTRCGGPRRSASGSTSPPSCAAWRRRPAIPSSSSRARAGRWSTCSSWATWRAPTSRSPPPPGWPSRCTSPSTSGGRPGSGARGRS